MFLTSQLDTGAALKGEVGCLQRSQQLSRGLEAARPAGCTHSGRAEHLRTRQTIADIQMMLATARLGASSCAAPIMRALHNACQWVRKTTTKYEIQQAQWTHSYSAFIQRCSLEFGQEGSRDSNRAACDGRQRLAQSTCWLASVWPCRLIYQCCKTNQLLPMLLNFDD
jgi:hypothetical protein